MMEAKQLAATIADWIASRVAEARAAGAVIGLSGGIDSAVVGALCRMALPGKVLGLIMPIHSNPRDVEHALLAARTLDIPVRTVILDEAYDVLVRNLTAGGLDFDPRGLAVANLKPRLRMMTLYFHANGLNYLVAGTGNRSELHVGYFTKYGDGGVDILPIGGLVKAQVRELARYLGVPQPIIDKAPSAGLWEGQTDEGEMGLTYNELDRYLLTGEGNPATVARIEDMASRSRHKLSMPPVGPQPGR